MYLLKFYFYVGVISMAAMLIANIALDFVPYPAAIDSLLDILQLIFRGPIAYFLACYVSMRVVLYFLYILTPETLKPIGVMSSTFTLTAYTHTFINSIDYMKTLGVLGFVIFGSSFIAIILGYRAAYKRILLKLSREL